MRLVFALMLLLAINFSARANAPVVIHIDQPSFEPIKTAVYIVEESKSPDVAYIQQRLSYFLNFTGIFQTLAPKSFEEVIKKSYVGSKLANLSAWNNTGIGLLIDLRMANSKTSMKARVIDLRSRKDLLEQDVKKSGGWDEGLRALADSILEKTTGKPGIYRSKIVFAGKRKKKDFSQIFICNIDGSGLEQITTHPSIHLSPSWSPDGRYITYTSYRDKNPDIWIYDREKNTHKKLSRDRGVNSGASWSRNGKIILFTGTEAGNADIFKTNPQGSPRQSVLKGRGLDVDPVLSPDGRWLAFVSGRFGNPHIFKAAVEWIGDEAFKIVGDTRLTFAGWYNATPAWSPDSQRIAFAGYDKDIDRFDIFVMNYDGKKMERLTLKSGDNESPTFSPNGFQVLFQSNRLGNQNIKADPQLFIMNRDGSNQTKIYIQGVVDAQTPKWSMQLN